MLINIIDSFTNIHGITIPTHRRPIIITTYMVLFFYRHYHGLFVVDRDPQSFSGSGCSDTLLNLWSVILKDITNEIQ